MAEKLEKMAEFFERRLDIYEEHQMSAIESAEEFYRKTAELLPRSAGAKVLDLGCGTGLELDFYYPLNRGAQITGIDLSRRMLDVLAEKFAKYRPELICASYFDVDFGREKYDAAVSVESLHHFPYEKKVPLYGRIREALRTGGAFILTDYTAPDEEAEKENFCELARRKRAEGLGEEEFYHFDTPLTAERECRALSEAGFSRVEVLGKWANTALIRAEKQSGAAQPRKDRF